MSASLAAPVSSPRVRVHCPGIATRVIAPGELLTLGRQEGNDLVLAHGSVSRRHARIQWDPDEDRPFVLDLGSANGLTVDGVDPGERAYLMGAGTRLELGEFLIVVDYFRPDEPIPAIEDDSDGHLEDDEEELNARAASKEEHKLVGALALAIKSRRQYPAGHPLTIEHADALLQRLSAYLLRQRSGALLVVREGRAELNGRRLRGAGLGKARLADFVHFLSGAGVAGLLLRGRFGPESLGELLDLFVGLEQVPEAGRLEHLAERVAQIPRPAAAVVLSPREVRELHYRSDDSSLREEELAFFYYSRLLASLEVSQLAVAHGRSPDLQVRQLRTSLMKTIEQLRTGVFEQRLLALTASPYPVGAAEPARGANACVLALAMGRQLGLGRGALADLGFAALYHRLGAALEPGDAAAAVAANLSAALRTRGFGDGGLLRLIVGQEQPPTAEQAVQPGPHPSAHPYSILIQVASAFDAWTHDPQAALSPLAALERLRSDPARFDPVAVDLLAEAFGHVPRGTFLRLPDRSLVVVIDGGRRGGLPIARTLVRADGLREQRGSLRALRPTELEQASELEPSEVRERWWRELVN